MIPDIITPNIGINRLKDAISVAGKNLSGKIDNMYALAEMPASIIKIKTAVTFTDSILPPNIREKIQSNAPPTVCPSPTRENEFTVFAERFAIRYATA